MSFDLSTLFPQQFPGQAGATGTASLFICALEDVYGLEVRYNRVDHELSGKEGYEA